MLVARNPGGRGAPSSPVGRPQPAGTGRSCWGASARPSATASRARRRAAWRPCGSCTCPRARPSRALRLCGPRLSRLTGVAAYEALCPWVKHTQYLAISAHLLDTILRTRFHAKLTARPRHTPPPCGQACVSGDLSRSAAAGRPAGADPLGAGLLPGRTSPRLTDHPRPARRHDRRRHDGYGCVSRACQAGAGSHADTGRYYRDGQSAGAESRRHPAGPCQARRSPAVLAPPYSPDLSPIEPCWLQVKTALRKAKARTRATLDTAIAGALAIVTSSDAHGWFRHCGYAF